VVLRPLDAMKASSLRALVERSQRGDETAFEGLIEPKIRSMLRLALAIVGDETDARDAVQEACVHAWRELPRLREPDRFEAWLGRILTNSCRMSLRGRRRRRLREVAVGLFDDDRGASILERPVEGPSENIEDLDMLSRAFDRLDPDLRIGLALHHLEGRSLAEVADLTGVSLATAKWRIHLGRNALGRALAAERP
jgi:RNA polymerase sigma-70 factor, ECF subfamily